MSTLEIHTNYRSRIHPKKFGLWVAFASIVMMFAALTSAYIVKQASGNWLEFQIPKLFFASTAALLISSMTMHQSILAYRAAKEQKFKTLLIITFILGLTFVVLQYFGWQELFSVGIDLKGNVSGSFFYLITGLHALHILGGIAALTVAMTTTFLTKFSVNAKKLLGLELIAHYWHFVDILWIYLLGFLILCK